MDSPLKWHGGKHYLAEKIKALQPKDGVIHRVETHGGSMAWTLAQDPVGVSEVINDTHEELMNFWEVLANEFMFERMQRVLNAVPFSEDRWRRSLDEDKRWYTSEVDVAVNRAIDFFIACRQSRAGAFKDFATLSRNRTRRQMNEQASAWWTTIDGLPSVYERMKRVVVLNRDALDVIRTQDAPGTLFYLDPPYLHETRATTGQYGDHEMTEDAHVRLLASLCKISGRFILSGYRSKLYDDSATRYGWKRYEFKLPNNAAGGESKRTMTECVWVNYC